MRFATIILLFLAAFSSILSAQPVLTYAVQGIQSGDTLIRQYSSTTTLFPGPGGSNVTWNFTNLGAPTRVDSGVFVAQNGPAPWSYNMVAQIHSSTPTDFDYFHVTADSLCLMGQNHNVPDLDPIEIHNPDKLLQFPMTYLDQFSDTYSGRFYSIAGLVTFTGRTRVVADAFGTVLLPGTSYTDVLRIHKRDTVVPSFGGTMMFDMYFFYSATEQFPVLVICDNCFISGNYVYSSQRNALNTAVTPGSEGPHVQTWPNPAQNEIQFESDQPGHLSVMNLQGQTVGTYRIHEQNQPRKLDVSGLASGFYILHFVGENGHWSGKMQVER